MYITKIELTEEDKQAILELQHKANELFVPIEKARSENMTSEEFHKANEDYFEVSRQLFNFREDIRRRYVAELSKDKEKALQNAKEILEAYTIEDYRREAKDARAQADERLASLGSLLKDIPEYKGSQDIQRECNYWKMVKATSGYNFKGAYHRLTSITVHERQALVMGGFGEEELDELISARAAVFYKPRKEDIKQSNAIESPVSESPAFSLQTFADSELIPFYSGPMTNIFVSASTKGITPSRGGDLKIEKQMGRSSFAYTLSPDDTGNKILSRLTPSTKKVFFRIIQTFTAANTYAPDSPSQLNPVVSINLKDFAKACKVPVDEIPQGKDAASSKEAAKAEMEFNNFRRKVKENINILYRISVDGKEPGKGKTPDVRFRLLEHIDTRARGGYFTVELTRNFATYLANAYVLQAPEAIYALPDTNPNCLPIGLKLSSHSSMRNNIIQGTADIIGVKALLEAASDIQSYDALIANNNRNWKRCIREPLEAALEANVDCGVIKEWYYCGSKGITIPEDELDSKTYQEYESLYIHFTMCGNREKVISAAKKKPRATQAKRKKAKGKTS